MSACIKERHNEISAKIRNMHPNINSENKMGKKVLKFYKQSEKCWKQKQTQQPQ